SCGLLIRRLWVRVPRGPPSTQILHRPNWCHGARWLPGHVCDRGVPMTGGTVLDIVLVLLLAAHATAMYRVGLVAGALSLAGLLGGGLLALWGLPRVLLEWSPVDGDPAVHAVLLIAGIFLAAVVGQQLGARVGARWRSWVTNRPARAVDSALGAAGALVVGAGLAWLAAGAVVGALPTNPAPVADSRVLQGIDRAMPASADRVITGAYRSLD